MATDRRKKPDLLSADLKQRLDQARLGLLSVHKSLLDHERARYERQRGKIENSGAFLQLVIHDPWFAWLHPVSELVVQIDEVESSHEPTAVADAEALLNKSQELLRPDEQGDTFQQRYHRIIQESPAVANAHAAWKQQTRPT